MRQVHFRVKFDDLVHVGSVGTLVFLSHTRSSKSRHIDVLPRSRVDRDLAMPVHPPPVRYLLRE